MFNILQLKELKQKKLKFASITVYDASFSRLFAEQGIKVMLIGDSLGMTIQGYNSTLMVTVKDIVYHTRCVRRGAPECLLLADLPFMSYSSKENAFNNAAVVMRAGANIIKLEGGETWIIEIIKDLTSRSIPICGHLGLTPQSINMLGSYTIQGRTHEQASKILNDALMIEKAGAKLLVVECLPEKLAKEITEKLSIPVIGIGSGVFTDGQILVMQDVLGITKDKIPSFAKNFLKQNKGISEAIKSYIKEVEQGIFPSRKHSF